MNDLVTILLLTADRLLSSDNEPAEPPRTQSWSLKPGAQSLLYFPRAWPPAPTSSLLPRHRSSLACAAPVLLLSLSRHHRRLSHLRRLRYQPGPPRHLRPHHQRPHRSRRLPSPRLPLISRRHLHHLRHRELPRRAPRSNLPRPPHLPPHRRPRPPHHLRPRRPHRLRLLRAVSVSRQLLGGRPHRNPRNPLHHARPRLRHRRPATSAFP